MSKTEMLYWYMGSGTPVELESEHIVLSAGTVDDKGDGNGDSDGSLVLQCAAASPGGGTD